MNTFTCAKLRLMCKEYGLSGYSVKGRLELIQMLQEFQTMEYNTDCAICTEPIETLVGTMMKLSCGHCYHLSCISRWVAVKSMCPLCKRAVNVHDVIARVNTKKMNQRGHRSKLVNILEKKESKRKMHMLTARYLVG